jgi:hypothetical protein
MNQYTVTPEYNKLISVYPLHYYHFYNMIGRARRKKLECDFFYAFDSFSEFIEAVGPLPVCMIKPSIGRFDHSIGYVFDPSNKRWNFRWEEFSGNATENIKRNKAWQYSTPTPERNKGGKRGGFTQSQIVRICPYCGKTGKGNAMFQYHFNKCSKKEKESRNV